MITDSQTNTVYLADNFKKEWPEEFEKLKSLLSEHHIGVKMLKLTRDPYCRDYMPVQVNEDTFVQYVFRPEEYFEIDEYRYISNPVQINLVSKLPKPLYSNIILDGCNMVKWTDKVIITDKVYEDNEYKFKSREAIKKQLEEELHCRVIVIPRYPGDKTGHADGLIRFIDANRVFVNKEYNNNLEWQNKFYPILDENKLTPVVLPCTMRDVQDNADGLYINYLHVGTLVAVPQFGPGQADAEALQKIQEVMGKTNTVVPFYAHEIAGYGGVLNCATWSVRE